MSAYTDLLRDRYYDLLDKYDRSQPNSQERNKLTKQVLVAYYQLYPNKLKG